VERVKSAVIQLPDPKVFDVNSLTAKAVTENDPELLDSQDMGSQKRQKLPPKVMLQQENDRLKEQVKQRDELLEQQRREMKQETDKQKDQVSQLMGQIALLLSQMEKGSNASSKLQLSQGGLASHEPIP
jgi:hypothetical protein